ncbi:MAG: hypothetical protein IKE92_03635 [Clostridiales bacterium]|nr:hypothetical protein [Clostridiales bacterium]
MLYILTALKCEASVLNGLPGELKVTGVGSRARDIVDALDLKPYDKVLNVGICAGKNKGRGYLINQVISMETGKRYYPDILFESGIEEMPLTTSPGIVNEVDDGMLVDMESAFICEKVMKTMRPSDVTFYKVVSDSGVDFMSAGEVSEMLRDHLPEIKKIARLMLENNESRSYSFLPEDTADKMSLTWYMRNELKDIEHYCVVAGKEKELTALLGKMEEEGRLPAKDKKAGREVLNEIYSYLR